MRFAVIAVKYTDRLTKTYTVLVNMQKTVFLYGNM